MHQLTPNPRSRQALRVAAAALSASILASLVPWQAIAQEYRPPNVGLPGRREGGGTRGDCLSGQKTLVSLTPDTNFGQTTRAYPTLYWYIPQIGAEAAEFVLLDDENNEVYLTTFQITDQSGVVSLTLPDTVGLPALEPGKDYHWYFSLICDFSDRSGDLYTDGWIRRVDTSSAPQLMRRLASAPESEHGTIYAEEGIWFDALDSLADQRRSRPTDPTVQSKWTALLESVGLGSVANEPFLSPNRD